MFSRTILFTLVNEGALATWRLSRRWEWLADLDLDFETVSFLSGSFDLDFGNSYCLDFLDGDDRLLDLISRLNGKFLLPFLKLSTYLDGL